MDALKLKLESYRKNKKGFIIAGSIIAGVSIILIFIMIILLVSATLTIAQEVGGLDALNSIPEDELIDTIISTNPNAALQLVISTLLIIVFGFTFALGAVFLILAFALWQTLIKKTNRQITNIEKNVNNI